MFPARFLILQETLVTQRSTLFLCLAALITASCGSQSAPATPTSPSTPTTTTPAIPAASTPLTLVSPASDDQLGTLRPTLTVTNPASAVSGRTYEFQLADRSDFTVGSGSKSSYFQVNLTKAGVAEGSGSTAFAVD